MANLGKKYTCYSCHTKFYDLGKPEPLCPKCGADQRDAEDAPVVTSHRSRRVVEVEVEEPGEPEPEFVPEAEASEEPVDDEDAELIVPEKEAEEEEEEEEEY